MANRTKVGIIGGGASGFFTALRVSEVARINKLPIEVHILEAGSNFLKKVSISGGGRCNVTNHEFEIQRFCENYPRGKKELRGAFGRFQAKDLVHWFRERGVVLVAEADGRMFPKTNTSSTIINCFMEEAAKNRVQTHKSSNVQGIRKTEKGFELKVHNNEELLFDSLVISTGSSPSGYRLAKSLGHSITDLAPSLFSFKIESSVLKGLSGTSFKYVNLKLTTDSGKSFKQDGPLLITHWGLSGPAVLKLSAWAAREMKASAYKARLHVNWLGLEKLSDVESVFSKLRFENEKSNISNVYPTEFTKRFWQSFLSFTDINLDKKYSDLSKKEIRKLIENLYNTQLNVLGKNRFKDEFVECGGVNLKEIDFKTMESKICPDLYMTGELLDIDGITGGFNFQNAWTTAWHAGTTIASKLARQLGKELKL